MSFHIHVEVLSRHKTVVEPGYNMNVAAEYSGYSGQPGSGMMFPGQPFVSGPVADVALQYGHTLAGRGSDYLHKNVSTVLTCVTVKSLESSW